MPISDKSPEKICQQFAGRPEPVLPSPAKGLQCKAASLRELAADRFTRH
jgi:hypothetical protein